MKGAAFFDLDRTLISGSSAMHFVKSSRNAGLVSRRDLARWAVEHLKFRIRGSTDESTEAALRAAEGILDGVPAQQLARMAPELLIGILPRIYPAMLAEVHAHQDEGRATFIVSAAGDEIVRLLAQVLGMDGGIGTRYAIGSDGRLTGRLDGPLMYGDGKVEAIRRFAAEHQLDLAQSWGYSDSVSDLPMLQAIGTAVVVNPDSELRAIADERGWRVMRFEKIGRNLAVGAAVTIAVALGLVAALGSRGRGSGSKDRFSSGDVAPPWSSRAWSRGGNQFGRRLGS